MHRVLSLASALSVAGLLAAGCGSSSSSSSSAPSGPAPASSAPAPAATGGAGGTVAIKMANIAFSPSTQTVRVGQKVVWTNEDQVAHNVTARSGASFRSSDFAQGKTFAYTPTKPGTIQYVCTIHPGMTATLTVTK